MADLHYVDPIQALAELNVAHAFLEQVLQVVDLFGLGLDLNGEQDAGFLRLQGHLEDFKLAEVGGRGRL
ncbi:hypothetical protein D3C80_1670570 [compost metagenome]